MSSYNPQILFTSYNSPCGTKLCYFDGTSTALNDTGVNWMWWAWWLIISWVGGSYLWFLCQKSYYHFSSVFCAKSHIIISLLSEPVSIFILIGCIAFQFFFWVIIDGLFSLPWIFSIDLSFYRKPKKDLSFYLPHPCFIIHALRSAYRIISLAYNFSFFLYLFILIGC